jgi:hypothetical protein
VRLVFFYVFIYANVGVHGMFFLHFVRLVFFYVFIYANIPSFRYAIYIICLRYSHLVFCCALIGFQACGVGTYGNVTGQTSQATACRVYFPSFSSVFFFCNLVFCALNIILFGICTLY